jgi:subtilisin family serine protease
LALQGTPTSFGPQSRPAPTPESTPNGPFESVLDDAVPLPISRVVEPSEQGDRVVAPASGDPYFLGFAGGLHYPPAGERTDPLLEAELARAHADGRPAELSWGFVMFGKRITEARLDRLRALGVRVIEFHPHYTMKVALSREALAQVAALDFVRWVGAARPTQKLHPVLARQVEAAAPGDVLDVYVSVFDSDLCAASEEIALARATSVDPDGTIREVEGAKPSVKWMSHGWQEKRLVELGLDVHEYTDRIRAFRARMPRASLEALLASDFVQFVEADLPAATTALALPHDESTTMISTDRTRAAYDGGTSSTVIAGFADSGLETAHSDLNIWGWGWDLANTTGPWNDENTHGTHVAGSFLGRGVGSASKKGNAPGLASWGGTSRFYNVRIFGASGSGPVSLPTVMGNFSNPINDGVSVTPRPDVCNHSWGGGNGGALGSEADCRTIDDQVHNQWQVHVFAAGNNGNNTAGSLLVQASAKNALTVGNVLDYRDAIGDPGTLWTNSSTGPTGDGRWKPNVTAPGRWISSADATTTSGYSNKSGTSMAAPHVAGLVAQILDHYGSLRSWPEPVMALLMASATTKDNAVLTTPNDTHLDNYGAGRVQAWRAHYPSSNTAWYVWNYDVTNAALNADFTVNAGATRLVVCAMYSEPAASAGASRALVNDYDLYIDSPPIDTTANNTGEYFAQQSTLSNCEIRSINTPPAGTWRWKLYNQSVTGRVYTGIAVQVIYGDTTPDGTLNVTALDSFVKPNENVTITATATNPANGSVGSAVFFDSTSVGDSLQSSSTTLDDGVVTDLMSNQHSGRDVLVGDLISGDIKSATWVTRWATEGSKTWTVDARSDNWVDKSDSVAIVVDGTAPSAPGAISSVSHPVNTWVSSSNATFTWIASTDALSGIDGYGEAYGSAAISAASIANLKDMEGVTTFTRTIPDGTWYWGLKAVDNSGNWGTAAANYGPIKIDTAPPTQPGVISSSTHSAGVQSCSTSVTLNWSASGDFSSGVARYVYVINTLPAWDPTTGTVLAAGSTSTSFVLASSTTPRYFHLRAQDAAGNWSATRTFGPLLVNASSVSTYCTAKTNSLGCVPAIGTNLAQPSKSAGTFTVTCSNVLNQKNGLLFWAMSSSATPFQGGFKCVGNPTNRTASISSGGPLSGNSCTGSYAFTFSTAYMNSVGLNPGDTVFAQWWMRDPASPSTTGLSNGVRFTVCQ